MSTATIPKVYAAIAAVQAVMAREGIEKGRTNQAQGYKFRGIDEIFNALSPVLAAHSLCFLPRILSRECTERVNAKGTALFYVTVEAEFDLIAAEDGSRHTIRTFGEAMDSGDKATNKAMSAAYKYAALQAFAIPTEGDNDADAHTHEVAPRQTSTDDSRADADRRQVDHYAKLEEDAKAACTVLGKSLTEYGKRVGNAIWYACAAQSFQTRMQLMKKAEAALINLSKTMGERAYEVLDAAVADIPEPPNKPTPEQAAKAYAAIIGTGTLRTAASV